MSEFEQSNEPIPSGESSPKDEKETSKTDTLNIPQQVSAGYKLTKFVKIWALALAPHLWRFAKNAIALGGTLISLGWALALWDSYRPKITVTPGPSVNSKDPFGTVFVLQNQGALPIRNISFNITWTYADANLPRNPGFGLTKISELDSLEQHALLSPPLTANDVANQPTEGTNQPPSTTNPNVPMPVEHHSLVLWFDVTYDPQFFGNRTTTIYFLGIWDTETNFQWVPTGHTDIRFENKDTNLLARAISVEKSIERSHVAPPPNAPTPITAPSPNSGPVNSAPNVKVGEVHKK